MSSDEELSETENDGFSGSEEDEWVPPVNKKSKKNVVSSDDNDDNDSSDNDDDFVEPTKSKIQKSIKTISIKPSTSKTTTADDESDSSGDDYLVDPNEIDLNSPFFTTDHKVLEPQIKPPTFDCNVGILSDDNEDSDEGGEGEVEVAVEIKETKANASSSSSLHKIVQFNENLEKAKKYLANFKPSTSGGSGGAGKSSNIKDLLAIGESSKTTTTTISKLSNKKRKRVQKSLVGSSDESEDWEEVDDDDNDVGKIENKNVNKDIVINIGPTIKKKSRVQIDAEASIKRKLNRIKKEKQLLLHKTHILCWIAHGNYVNPVLNNTKLMELCLKFFPKQCYPKDKTDQIFFEQMIKWYKSQISLKSKHEYCQLPKLPPLFVSLALQIKSKVAISKRDYVLIFIILLRAIGVQSRLVLNFVTLPLRPPTNELLKITMKTDEDKKKDVKLSSKSTKSKYFNSSSSKSKEKSSSSNLDKHAKSNSKKNSEIYSKLSLSPLKQSLKTTSLSSPIPGPSCSVVKSPEETTSAYFSPNKVNISSKSRSLTESNKISVRNKTNQKDERNSKPENISKSTSLQPSTSKSRIPEPKQQRNKSVGVSISKLKKINPSISNKTPPSATLNAKPVTTNLTPIARRTRAKREALKFPQLDGGNDEKRNLKSKPNLNKIKTISKTKTSTTDEDSDFIEPPKNKKQKISSNKKIAGQSASTSSNNSNKKNTPKVTSTASYKQIDRRLLSDEDSPMSTMKKDLNSMNIWIEVFSEKEEKWLSIDLFKLKVNCIEHLRNQMTKPISYIFGWNNNNTIKDITSRYTLNWNTVTRKLRIEQQWIDETLEPYKEAYSQRNFEEDMELTKIHLKEPLPTIVSEYKDHPLYALERHLLKFQAIYPENATPVGFIRKEPVYPRDCVHTLHSREIWVKQARVVKLGQQPYKIVKARPKWDRQSGKMLEPLPLEIFGFWQTQPYEPPTAENGIVPRNAYGNVELFKPEMLPKKTVHLQLSCLNRTCKKMGIDCAQAVVGFEFSGGGSHPVYDGYVICEEFSEQVVAQWVTDQEEAYEKEKEKNSARIYGNWKKLIRGLFIRARLQRKYNFVKVNDDDDDDDNDISGSKKIEATVSGSMKPSTTFSTEHTKKTRKRK